MVFISLIHIRKRWRHWLIRLIVLIVVLYGFAVALHWLTSVYKTSPMSSPHGPIMLTKQ